MAITENTNLVARDANENRHAVTTDGGFVIVTRERDRILWDKMTTVGRPGGFGTGGAALVIATAVGTARDAFQRVDANGSAVNGPVLVIHEDQEITLTELSDGALAVAVDSIRGNGAPFSFLATDGWCELVIG